MKKRIKPLDLGSNLLIYIYALILTLPLFFALITAFKTEPERVLNPIGLPESLNFDNFITAWKEGNLLVAAKNSIIVSVGTTALQLANIVLVSFCLNRIRDKKMGTFLYMVFLCGMFIPHVGTATNLVMRRNLGLYNNLWGEILVGATSVTTGVFLVSGFLRTIPRDLEEAAMLDGANDFQICTNVIVPVIKPSLVTVGILTFRTTWNNALGPMLYLRDEKLYTIPMALLLNFSNETSIQYTTLFAGVIMTAIPLVIVYCKCQKHFESALAGGVKG